MPDTHMPGPGSAFASPAPRLRVRPPVLWAGLGLLLVVLLCLPYLVEPFWVHLGILIAMYGSLATAWNWLGGYAGQVSLGHAVFFGLGAYGTSVGQLWWGLNPWVGTALGVLAAVLFSLVVGYPCFRLRGHYFAIATIAVGEIVGIVFTNWERAGGAVGLFLPLRPSSLLNFQFKGKAGYFYIVLVILALGLAVTRQLERTRPGYYFRAIKEDPDAARALGIDIVRYKLMAMALSAGLTALVGAFWANYVLFIDPESVLPMMLSIQICLVAVLGGVGSLWGPLVGACILIPISELTRTFLGGTGRGIDLVMYGFLIMLVAVVQPAGIMGALRGRRRRSKAGGETG